MALDSLMVLIETGGRSASEELPKGVGGIHARNDGVLCSKPARSVWGRSQRFALPSLSRSELEKERNSLPKTIRDQRLC